MAAKTLKKSVSLTDSEAQTFLEGEENNILKEKSKVKYSAALVLAFLSAENENRQLEDLPLADFGRLPDRLLLSIRTNSINKNFVFVIMIRRIFPSEGLALTHPTIVTRGLSIHLFSFINEVGFSSQ